MGGSQSTDLKTQNSRNTKNIRGSSRGRITRSGRSAKPAECEGYVLTQDIQEYADDLRNKMDFINGDSTSTAQKINELKALIEERVKDNTDQVKGNNTYSMTTLQTDLANMKETLETKMQSIIDGSSAGSKIEVKSHISEEIKNLKDQLNTLIGTLETYDNAVANNESLKRDVNSSLSSFKSDMLSALLTKESAVTQGESLKRDMASNMSSLKTDLLSALRAKDSSDKDTLRKNVTSDVTTAISKLVSPLQTNENADRLNDKLKQHLTSELSSTSKDLTSTLQTNKNADRLNDKLKQHLSSELLSTKNELLSMLQTVDVATKESDSMKKHVETTSNSLYTLIESLDSKNTTDLKEHLTKEIELLKDNLSSTIQNAARTQKGSEVSGSGIEYLKTEGDETQRNVKSVLKMLDAKKREEMDNVLGLTNSISQSIKNNAVLQYLELTLCEDGSFFDLAGAFCKKMDDQYETISNTIPACKEYFQSKKDNTEKAMSAACEYSLANIASSCLANDVCEKCGSDGSASCRTNCWYVNEFGQSKFEIRPYCESMLNDVTESYKNRQFIYSLNRLKQCDSNLCKQYEISNSMRYKPDACNLSLDSDGNLVNMTAECSEYLNKNYNLYEEGCNESFQEQYNIPSICTNNRTNILQSL